MLVLVQKTVKWKKNLCILLIFHDNKFTFDFKEKDGVLKIFFHSGVYFFIMDVYYSCTLLC